MHCNIIRFHQSDACQKPIHEIKDLHGGDGKFHLFVVWCREFLEKGNPRGGFIVRLTRGTNCFGVNSVGLGQLQVERSGEMVLS